MLASQAGATPCGGPLTITTPTTLTSAQINGNYSDTLTATGCVSSWSIIGGSLPAGLTLNSGTGVISGTAPGTVESIPLTIQANGSVSENVELPVVDAIKVDPAGGELTGATNDGNLAYFAGPTSGDVFDLDTNNPPQASGTALTGLDFPAAVTSAVGLLFATQFREPAGNGQPFVAAFAPSSTSSPATVVGAGGFTSTCADPDGITSPLSSELVSYSCAGSGEVDLTSTGGAVSLGAHSVPSGLNFDSNFDLWVAEAGNDQVVELDPSNGGTPIATVPVPAGSEPANVAFDSSNGYLYVADPGTDQISQIDTGTVDSKTPSDLGEIQLPAGSRPFGVAVNSAGTTLVATDSGTDTANVIDVSVAKPVIEYSPQVGGTPDGVTIVGSEAFVADEQGGTVTVIDPPAAAKSLKQRLVISHHERHATVNRVALRRARTEARRLKRDHKRPLSRRALLKLMQRGQKKHHRASQARVTSIAPVADPLVAPLPNPFRDNG